MKKRAFTLSELLISLTIIGIIAAITIPVLNNVRPNKDKVTYNKGIMTIQQAFNKATDQSVISDNDDYWLNNNRINDNYLCESIAEDINISGGSHCNVQSSSYDSPNFITTDGIRFWGFEGKFTDDTRIVYLDRKLTDNEKANLSKKRDSKHSTPGMKIILHADGRATTGASGTTTIDPETGATTKTTTDFDYENKLILNAHSVSD